MELRILNTFLKVAQLQSFSKAADSLGYSQSAITVQVQQLENELGVRLFDPLDHLEQPSPAGYAVSLERRRHGETDRFFGAALVGYDKKGVERIQSAVDALDRGVEGF